MLDYGQGIQPNPEKAFENYLVSARDGFARAQFNLGFLYESGAALARLQPKLTFGTPLRAKTAWKALSEPVTSWLENEALRSFICSATPHYAKETACRQIAWLREWTHLMIGRRRFIKNGGALATAFLSLQGVVKKANAVGRTSPSGKGYGPL